MLVSYFSTTPIIAINGLLTSINYNACGMDLRYVVISIKLSGLIDSSYVVVLSR